jgi:nitroreductase
MMDALDCILTRRSTRKFSDIPLEWEKVGILLEAAIHAPSAGNLQNWKFIVVTDKDARRRIADAALQQRWMETAPVHIIVCSEPEKAEQFYGIRGERLYSIQNCAAAVENILLAAHAQGLAGCWVGAFDEEMLKRVLGIPDIVRPQAIVPVGYSSETHRKATRQPMYDKVFIESFGSRIKDIQHVMGYHSARVQKVIQAGRDALEGKHSEDLSRPLGKGREFISRLKTRMGKK